MDDNETESKELTKVEPGEVAEMAKELKTELERQVVFHGAVQDAYMLDIENEEGLEPGHSVRARVKRDAESGKTTVLSVGAPADLKEFDEVLAKGGYNHDMAGVTDKSVERAQEKFPYLYSLARQLGLPPPATEAEVDQLASAVQAAPFAELEAAATALTELTTEKEGEHNHEQTTD